MDDKYFVISIGGTGMRCVEAFTHLCAMGMFGNKEIIRLASPSRFLSGPRILILVMLQSSEMIKFTNTRPFIPISWAISGYRKFLLICLFICS